MIDNEVSRVNSVKKCPICGGELERSYAVSKWLYWGTEKHTFLRGGKELLSKYPALTETNFPALRCLKCHIIILDYEKEGINHE
jgi:hypothetical protein